MAKRVEMNKLSRCKSNIVDVMACDLIGEMQLDIMSYIDSSSNITDVPPIRCNVFFMKSELYVQVKLLHNKATDMLEAIVEVMSGLSETMKFSIKYGMRPYLEYTRNQQIFIFTPTNRRSNSYPICKLADLVDFMVDNEASVGNQNIEFICTLIISVRHSKLVRPEYQIATVNARDADHKLICQGLEIHVHRYILMGASQFFHRRLTAQPLFNVTVIDRLDKSKQLEKDVLTCLLRFMYGLNIHPHNLCTTNLLSAAREFEVNKLFQICEKSLINQLCPEMAGELFYIGKTEKASELTFEAAKYIIKNYIAVKKRYEWDAIMKAFPKFFAPIKINPMKYFRAIAFPEIRSKSTGDLHRNSNVSFSSVSFLLRQPQIIPTRPISHEVKGKITDEASGETRRESIEESITDSRRDSTNTISASSSASTLHDVESLNFESDMQPIRRKRSSPVVTRRSSESSSSVDPFNMSALHSALPELKFSRETLKKRLLANETKFEESFGPAMSSSPSRSVSLSSSFSELDKNKGRPVSAVHHRYSPEENIDFKWKFYQKDFEMDCSEDSKLDETESLPKTPLNVDPATPPSQLSSASLASMRSLVFGQLYSYSSDSVFERSTPKSMSTVSEVKPMSVSEVPSTDHGMHRDSPKAMKRIDFQTYTHPDARTLSNVSSLTLDSSSFETDPSLSSKPKSRKEKRLKKNAEKTRKLFPGAEATNLLHDSSTSHQSSELTTSDQPLPEISAGVKTPEGKRQSQSKSHKKGIRKRTTNSPDTTTSEKIPEMPLRANEPFQQRQPKKVTFDETPELLSYDIVNEEIDEPEQRDIKYYENWLDTAAHLGIQNVFEEASGSQNIKSTKLYQKTWDEEETNPLRHLEHVKIKTEITPRVEKHSSAPTTSSLLSGSKEIKKSSSIKTASSATSKFPISGGVIKKDPARFKKSSVDEPQPHSSSESDRSAFGSSTPSSSSSRSIEDRKIQKDRDEMNYESDPEISSRKPSTLVRTKSFADLRTAYIAPVHYKQRRRAPPLADKLYTIGLQDLISKQRIESDTQLPEGDLKQKVKKVEGNYVISSAIDVNSLKKIDRGESDDNNEEKQGN